MDEKLRQDFPVDWEEDHYVSRREFFKFMTLASGGLAAGSVAVAGWSQISREERKMEPAMIANVSDVNPGAALAFSYPRPSDLCILVHKKDGEWSAFSRRCTHLSCPVDYQSDHDRLFCPCHNGAFSVEDGRVLQGPPPHSLPKIQIEVRGDEIWAVGIAKGETL